MRGSCVHAYGKDPKTKMTGNFVESNLFLNKLIQFMIGPDDLLSRNVATELSTSMYFPGPCESNLVLFGSC